MRREISNILAKELRLLAIETRARLGLTQKEMGERLLMSESSYSDIETGKSACGALTEALLLDMQDDPKTVLHRVTQKIAEWYEKEMQTA